MLASHAKGVPPAPTDRRMRPVPCETETETIAFAPSSIAQPRAARWLALGVPLAVFGVFGWLRLISGAPLSLLEPGFQLSSLLKDLALLLLFILPHSVFSRGVGRRLLNRPFGPCGERPLFVFVSGITLVLMTQLWETTGPVLWDLNDWPHFVARCMQAVGLLLTTWAALVVGSALLIGLPHLKELRRGGAVPSAELIALAPYSRIRQPINLGILLMIAGMTEVTVDRLMLGLLTALWIFLAAPYEERDATLEFGEGYEIYLGDTPRWIPKKAPQEE